MPMTGLINKNNKEDYYTYSSYPTSVVSGVV